MRHLFDLYDSTIMQRALIEAVLVGALSGAVGVHVLLRRLPFFTITVAHATFPGVVVAVIVGASVLAGAIVFAAVLVVAMWLTGSRKAIGDIDRRRGRTRRFVRLRRAMLQSTQDSYSQRSRVDLGRADRRGAARDIDRHRVIGAVVLRAWSRCTRSSCCRRSTPPRRKPKVIPAPSTSSRC